MEKLGRSLYIHKETVRKTIDFYQFVFRTKFSCHLKILGYHKFQTNTRKISVFRTTSTFNSLLRVDQAPQNLKTLPSGVMVSGVKWKAYSHVAEVSDFIRSALRREYNEAKSRILLLCFDFLALAASWRMPYTACSPISTVGYL